MHIFYRTVLAIFFLGFSQTALAQSAMAKKEAQFYKIVDVPIPDDIMLEVGGLAFTDNDKLGVSTRRGDVWVIDKPYGKTPAYTKFAQGLHEPLGLNYRDNSFYLSQRGELTPSRG